MAPTIERTLSMLVMALHSAIYTMISKDTYLMQFQVVTFVKKRDRHIIRIYHEFTASLPNLPLGFLLIL